jgi:hypothetical protein
MNNEIPEEIVDIIMILEAKQVLRGCVSNIFPDMTKQQAKNIYEGVHKRLRKEYC